MTDYRVFGGCLRSELAFPELPPLDADLPDWVLTVSHASPPSVERSLLGRDTVAGDVQVRLLRTPSGFRLVYDDSGVFDIREGGRRVVWYPPDEADVEAVRQDVVGRVLPVALHMAGVITLHGSAVSWNGAGLAFSGPKRHGKSTLAQALLSAGARLLADDALPVEQGPPPCARPGVHVVRLPYDSAAALAVGRGDDPPGRPTRRKVTLSRFPPDRLEVESVPLAAVYLLDPEPAGTGDRPARRRLLPPVKAAVALVGQAKLGPLLGGPEAPLLLEAAGRLADRVPVYTLRLSPNLGRLADVARQVLDWHGTGLAARAEA